MSSFRTLFCGVILTVSVTSTSLAKPAFDQSLSPMRPMHPYSEPFPEDNFLNFMENLTTVTNIAQLEAQGLTQGRATVEPWAGSYWPTYKGLLGARYADPAFPKSSKVFSDYYSYYMSNPSSSLLHSGQMDRLSPAEKYDLLIGDGSWGLTRHMWQKGAVKQSAEGRVATWEGICHGWSGATHMGEARPERSVTVTGVNGHQITFQPSDVAALISYAWTDHKAPFVGRRCKMASVQTDPYGRPIEPTCLDSNPAAWHQGITNKLGLHGQSFVMDVSSGSEVWNYSALGYDYHYFNPRTFETSHTFKSSVVPISIMTNDRYTAHRSPRAKYLVGIAMDVHHPNIVSPRMGVAKENSVKTLQFMYDLELDENYNIVGGEWYSYHRPDFLWAFPSTMKPYEQEDNEITEEWDGTTRLPDVYASKAKAAIERRGVILGRIAQAIHKLSLIPTTEPIPDGENTSPDVPIDVETDPNTQPDTPSEPTPPAGPTPTDPAHE